MKHFLNSLAIETKWVTKGHKIKNKNHITIEYSNMNSIH